MIRIGLTMKRLDPTRRPMRRMFLIGAVCANGLLGGCVNVTAPDKPIEINLNINIKQEIVYKLDGDAKKLIEQNSEIF